MGGSSGSQNTQSAQNTISNPWAPTQPLLNNILQQLGSQGTAVTGNQGQAIGALEGAASGLPNFGGAGANIANQYLSGNANQGVAGALGNLQGNLSGIANPANLNPLNTPGLSQA